MRLLYITPDVPYPADQGAKLRNLALMQAAAKHHQVDLISFYKEPLTEEQHQELAKLCGRVELVPTPGPRALIARAWSFWFDALPDIAHRYESAEFRTRLWELLEQQRYDVIQIEGMEMMTFLAAARGGGQRAAVVYDAHNAEMYLQRTMFQAEFRSPLRWHAGLYSMTQWSKLGTYERVMMNATDMVLAVSDIDAAKLKGRHVDPIVVPHGVYTASLPYRVPSEEPGRTLLFVGPLGYRPNADAVRWLVGKVLPLVRAKMPDVQLRLVGRGTERVQAPGVVAVGYVDDVAAELAQADVVPIPMRMGGGVRFKVLEAMASGVPVVSTPTGMMGIAAEPDRHALIASNPATFADSILRLLQDRELARTLSREARRLVETQYDWSKITPDYLRHLTTARRLARSRGSEG
jgi:polysaccharide biosynthesis protein PslH